MRCRLLTLLLLLSFFAKSQPCKLLTQTFAIADTIKKDSEELYRFRFSTGQLDALQQLPDLEKAVLALKKLQKTLDEDNASYRAGTLWQLDEKLAQKHFDELKRECPETGFKVFEREIAFYKSRCRAKYVK